MSAWYSPIQEDRLKWKRWASEYKNQTGFLPPISVMVERFPGLTPYQANIVLDGLGRTKEPTNRNIPVSSPSCIRA